MSIEAQVYSYIKERDEHESEQRSGTSYYLELFKVYEKNKSYKIKWNTCAALFGNLWLAYRGMYVYAIAWIFGSTLLSKLIKYYFSRTTYFIFLMLFLIVGFITFGCFGNWLYIKFINKRIEQNIMPAKVGFRNIFYVQLLIIFFGFILILLGALSDSFINILHMANKA